MPLTVPITALAAGTTERDHVNPMVTGVGVFIALTILLLITLQFNKDR